MSVPDPANVDWVPLYAPGIQGYQGVPGPQGAQGAQGAQGVQGPGGAGGPAGAGWNLVAGNRSLQGGSWVGDLDGSGGGWIGYEFPTNPISGVAVNGDWGAAQFVCVTNGWGIYSMYVMCWHPVVGMLAGSHVRINWMVYGYN